MRLAVVIVVSLLAVALVWGLAARRASPPELPHAAAPPVSEQTRPAPPTRSPAAPLLLAQERVLGALRKAAPDVRACFADAGAAEAGAYVTVALAVEHGLARVSAVTVPAELPTATAGCLRGRLGEIALTLGADAPARLEVTYRAP